MQGMNGTNTGYPMIHQDNMFGVRLQKRDVKKGKEAGQSKKNASEQQ